MKRPKKTHAVTLSLEVIDVLANRVPEAESFDAALRVLLSMAPRPKRVYTGLSQFVRKPKPAA